jgi:zinc transporter ZupT
MMVTLLVLFFTPLLSGLAIFLLPRGRHVNFRLLLVFAGAYLFSITVIHILPELYRQHVGAEWVGLCVLGGFFLQQLLEYFTSGVEHGHMHNREDHNHHSHGQHHHDHSRLHSTESQKALSALVLLIALCIHAFLEGAMLAQPESIGSMYDQNAILLGIALHRAPAAFALMTVLAFQLGSRKRSIPYLLGFSLAAPIGLLISSHLSDSQVISQTGMIFLYAVVCGNFLHISTTIVFESSPEHHFNARKLAVAIFGALLAVGVEYIIN